eukprot:Partr_v1_DN27918_c0_g1_i1_m11377 putative Component of the PAM complex, a complex required for the translocation of transit peptide-containing proteins from the inner membrane into the mitochondrial matrix in an ATP-dependent manner
MTQTLPWNEYFRLRLSRNRIRPVLGVPFFVAATAGVITMVPFNPVEPILGIDAAFVYGLGSVAAGLASYQVGGVAGNALWRLTHRSIIQTMDKMDKRFYSRIAAYRAERGQSPYIQNAENVLKFKKRNSDMALRQDFYGEKIRSVQDYRHWLRRQKKLVKEQQ